MSGRVEAWLLSGAGNDFVALAEPAADPDPATVRAWCARGVSLGADGLFVLRRRGPGAVAMRHFNADGGEAALCLNGTRCAAQLACHLGWDDAGAVAVTTGAGELVARKVSDREVAVALPVPGSPPRHVELVVNAHGREERVQGSAIEIGVPHLVVPWHGSLAGCPVAQLGPPLRHHPELGTAGANVDFVRAPSPHELQVRSYERGVEGETLACGTGVLAAVACGVATLQLTLPVRATTRGGFVLTVDGVACEGILERWELAGDARVLARAEVFAGAAHLPSPSQW